MIIFRNRENKKLYTIALVSPPKYTGSWYEAEPYLHKGKKIKLRSEEEIQKKFVAIAQR